MPSGSLCLPSQPPLSSTHFVSILPLVPRHGSPVTPDTGPEGRGSPKPAVLEMEAGQSNLYNMSEPKAGSGRIPSFNSRDRLGGWD